MPARANFLNQIKEAGDQIRNEEGLTEKARLVPDWPSAVEDAAATGRKEGMLFERVTASGPTYERLATIQSRFSFTRFEASAVVNKTPLAGQRA